MKSGIYVITNLKNFKCYVGASKNLRQRLYNHKMRLRINKHKNVHLQSAFNKYGEENFTFEIVERCAEHLLADREQAWINDLGTLDASVGYNKSDVPYGAPPPIKTETQVEKLRKSGLAAYQRRVEQGYYKLAVMDIDTQEIEYFDSPADCPYNFKQHGSISERKVRLRVKDLTPDQLKAKLVKKANKLLEIINNLPDNWTNEKRRVWAWDKKTEQLIKEFESIGEATTHFNLPNRAISNVLNKGGYKSTGGIFFTDTPNPPSSFKVGNQKEVIIDGILYESILECSRQTGLSPYMVYAKLGIRFDNYQPTEKTYKYILTTPTGEEIKLYYAKDALKHIPLATTKGIQKLIAGTRKSYFNYTLTKSQFT